MKYKANDIRNIFSGKISDFEEYLRRLSITDENDLQTILNAVKNIKYESKIFKACFSSLEMDYDCYSVFEANGILTYESFEHHVQNEQQLVDMILKYQKMNYKIDGGNGDDQQEEMYIVVRKIWRDIHRYMIKNL